MGSIIPQENKGVCTVLKLFYKSKLAQKINDKTHLTSLKRQTI